jgi:hypothetical protein
MLPKSIFAALLLAGALAAACGPNGPAATAGDKPVSLRRPTATVEDKPAALRERMPAAELATYQRCTSDADCIWITNGCCDCANGGVEVAIARDRKGAFEARFDCGNLPCTSRGREIECGTGSVACENTLCVFHPAVEAP